MVVMRHAEREIGSRAAPQMERFALLEVRPASGATTTLPASSLETARAVAHVVAVQRVVAVAVKDAHAGDLQVVGVDTNGPLRLPTSEGSRGIEIVKGRGFGPDDVERPVALVGRDYARIGKTIYGYQIAGMLDHNPPIRLKNAEVRVVGMFTTGDPWADRQVLLPLATAERLFGLAGQTHRFYVQVDQPANVEQVTRDLRLALGDGVIVERITS